MQRLPVCLACICVYGCGGDEEPEKRSGVPIYLTNKEPRVEDPLVWYTIPENLPIEMAEKYAGLQELLTKDQFIYFLTTIDKYCQGEISEGLMKVRIQAKLSVNLPSAGFWYLPAYIAARKRIE